MPRRLVKRRKKRAHEPFPRQEIPANALPTITIIDYNEEGVEEKQALFVEECFPFRDKASVTWINVEGLQQAEVIKKIGEHFGLHPLLQEDIVNTDQRPKIEYFSGFIFLIVRMLMPENGDQKIVSEQISLILGKNFVISFQEGKSGDVFNPVRERIRKGRFGQRGADYLLYSLLDAIVDNYYEILEKLGERIELTEESLISGPSSEIIQEMYSSKREMIFLRRTVWPFREVLNSFSHTESSLIDQTTHFYLRDVHDHTIQIIDNIETFRDMLSGMLEIYLTSTSNKLNEIMKMLTIVGTIFIPLTFVTGLYGMNFDFMPELKWRYGYFATLGAMFLLSLLMLGYFKKKKWL